MYEYLYTSFKIWGANGKILLVSDTHFGDYDENDWLPAGHLIEKIKAKVTDCDTLICLGDCGDAGFFKEIKCYRKILIKGNHDEEKAEYYMFEGGFSEVYDGPLFIARDILLSHEPVYGVTCCLNIHGHMHTGKHIYRDEQGGRHVNLVGPAVAYEPLELGEILRESEKFFKEQ